MCQCLIPVVFASLVGGVTTFCTWKFAECPLWPDAGVLGIVVGALFFLTQLFVVSGQFVLAILTLVTPIYAILLHFLDNFEWWPDAICYSLLPGLATMIFMSRLMQVDFITPIFGIVGTCLLRYLAGLVWWQSIAYGGLITLGLTAVFYCCIYVFGFGPCGIIGGSCAAGCQGPDTVAGSCFSCFQSIGASGYTLL